MKKKKIALLMVGAVMSCSMFFTGCDSKSAVIPEDIISNVVNINKDVKSFYGQSKMETYENDKKTSTIIMKEWNIPGNKVRREVTSETKPGVKDRIIMTCDGKKMIIYTKSLKSYMVSTNIAKDEFLSKSPKQVAMDQIAAITKTHTIEIKGEETVNGRDTYHLCAKVKKGEESNVLFKEGNYWIDKENWFVVKSENTSTVGNMKTVCEYEKVDFKPEIKDSMFTQEIPKNAKVDNLDDGEKEKKITLDEADKKLGKKSLIYKGNDYKLEKITYLKNDKEIGEDFNQVYTNNKGIEMFTLTMKKSTKLSKEAEDIKIPGEKDIEIRGVKADCMDSKRFKCIHWVEDEINYSVFTTLPNVTIDDCKSIVRKLQYTK